MARIDIRQIRLAGQGGLNFIRSAVSRLSTPRGMRNAIVVGVILGAALLAVIGAVVHPYAPLALAMLPLLLIIVVWFLVKDLFDWSPVLILIAAAFLPISFSTGTESRLVDSLVLTIGFFSLWMLSMITAKKEFKLYPSQINKPLIGLIIVIIISLVWSNFLRNPLVTFESNFPIVQTASAVVMIMLPGALLLVANHVKDIKTLKMMTYIMLVAGVLAFIAAVGSLPIPVNSRGLFAMWVISLALGQGLFNEKMSTGMRIASILLAAAWMVWGFGLNPSWLAGWLPGFVAAGVLVLIRSHKVFMLLVLLAVLVAVFNLNYVNDLVQAELNESGFSRLEAWQVNWRVTSQYLLFGTGPAGYAAYYMTFFPQEGMATHSNYIDLLSQLGLTGLFLVIWFFVAIIRLGYQVSLRLRGQADFSEALVNASLAGSLGCVVMMAFGDWLFPFAYTQTIAGFDYVVYSWLFMGAIPVIDRFSRQNAADTLLGQ